ncbi:MAG: T9SS type A sorting domain-containing protein [Bacteroidota bacterium]
MIRLFQIFGIFLLGTISLNAQTYQFDAYPQPYQYLQGDSSISEGIPWYNTVWDLPIGFDFVFMGHSFNHFNAWNEGLYFDLDNQDLFIEPYEAFLLDKGYVTPGTDILSPVSILHDGQASNRIFKIQYRNAGFEDGGAQDSVNFQIWLYETSNVVEIHFGPRNIVSSVWQAPLQGPIIAFISSIDDRAYVMEGDPNSPTARFFHPSDTLATSDGLFGAPPQNLVYRFTPPPVDAVSSNSDQPSIKISPNPFCDFISIDHLDTYKEFKVNLFDAAGNLVLTQTMKNNKLDLSKIANGAYALEVISGSKRTIKKIIKQK